VGVCVQEPNGMSLVDDYAAAVWTHDTRTLAVGSPGAPTTAAQALAAAVWTEAVRTLSGRAAVYATAVNLAQTSDQYCDRCGFKRKYYAYQRGFRVCTKTCYDKDDE
jgi:hypothetical protein